LDQLIKYKASELEKRAIAGVALVKLSVYSYYMLLVCNDRQLNKNSNAFLVLFPTSLAVKQS